MRILHTVRHGAWISLVCSVATVATVCAGDGSRAQRHVDAPNLAADAPAAHDKDTPDVAWTEVVEVASGGGYAGPWRMNESKFHYVDDPSVTLRDDGDAGVVWVDNRRKDAFFQRYTRDGQPQLDSPVNVSRSPGVFSWLPCVISTGDGEVFVLWQEIVFSGGSHGGEIFFARSSDGGRTFARPSNLSNTPAGAGKGRLTEQRWDNGSLDLVQATDGTLIAAWTEYEGALRVSRSTDGGQSFSEPLHVNAPDEGRTDKEKLLPARAPSLGVASGTVYLAWTVGEKSSADIHIAVSRDTGQSFGAPRIVAQTKGYSDAPKVAVDTRGTVHLVHTERRGGMFGVPHVQHTRRPAGEDDFEPPKDVAGPPVAHGSPASFPSLGLDADNNVVVLWEHHPHRGAPARGLGLAVSRDGGHTFTAPAVIPRGYRPGLGVNGSRQGSLMDKLAVNRKGEIAVVNSHFRKHRHSHVRLLLGHLK